MTLDELYQRMSGSEIDERLALAVLETPEFKRKMADEAEAERIKNLSPEDQAELFAKLFNTKIKRK